MSRLSAYSAKSSRTAAISSAPLGVSNVMGGVSTSRKFVGGRRSVTAPPPRPARDRGPSGFGEQLLDQLVQLVQVGGAHIGFHDLSPLVDDVGGGRDAHITPGLSDGTGIVQGHLAP